MDPSWFIALKPLPPSLLPSNRLSLAVARWRRAALSYFLSVTLADRQTDIEQAADKLILTPTVLADHPSVICVTE